MAASHCETAVHRFPQILGLCTLLQDLPHRGERDGLPLHPGPSGDRTRGDVALTRHDGMHDINQRVEELDSWVIA